MEVSMSSVQGRSVSRRAFIQGAAGAAIASRGVYSLLNDFVTPQRAQAATVVARRQEQYLIDSLEVILDNKTTLVIPPIFNDVITAKLKAGKTWDKAALKAAQTRLENALATVEKPYPSTAAGLTIVVAWGLEYFRTFVSGPWGAKAPKLLPTTSNRLAVEDAIAFPSDPPSVVLEDNHVAFKIRSDKATTLQSVEAQLFDPTAGSIAYIGDLFDLTSKRVGFAGRGFDKISEAKTRALAHGIVGASQIPDKAQLMMGFTSTQTQALGPDNIPSFETLRGITDQFPSGYFAHGCAMHLSHLYLDILSWYGRPYADRVMAMMSAQTPVQAEGTVTYPNGPAQVATAQQVKNDAATKHRIGHNEALQTATRLANDTLDNYGRLRSKGTAVPAREDFNTLDAPFSWYVDSSGVQTPTADQPGLHFAVFIPATSKFHAARLAMDGVLPDGTNLRTQYGLTDDKIGINSTMRATHRQNYVVPPRAHRSFPLAELL
jgi:hypothetical protein